jgi:hypothetical protein
MQTAPPFRRVEVKAPIPALPLVRRRLLSATHRSPTVLPQARALQPWDEQKRADGDGKVEMQAEPGHAPTYARPAVLDRRPGAATSRVEQASGQPAPATIARRSAETMPLRESTIQRASLPTEQPALPLVRRTASPRVQRAQGSQPPPASPEPAQPEPTTAAPASPPDLQALARKVYPILKRMLAVERERLRGA